MTEAEEKQVAAASPAPPRDLASRAVGPDDPLPKVKNIVLVMSGKGGVGKSSVACNLAMALTRAGWRVGLLDADIYGPSIPTMLGVTGRPMSHGALQQFMKDVAWGDLDFLVMDLPPGTGDVALTLSQKVKASGAVIVTAPQGVATDDVFKSG